MIIRRCCHGAPRFGIGFQEAPGRVRVTHGGLLVEPEDLGEVERVGAVDHGFFELSVDAEPLQRAARLRVEVLIQWLLARMVRFVVWLLISRWRFAVFGQRVPAGSGAGR
ncbi:hypothetical protein ACIQ9R_38250 [Streptomyces sp. NPDC094447]|uniref:hypothetical protein n=1 Tax=Streptomyces sp. NPDC094447 TaxID=3366062 RepID=UPI003808C46F